MYGIGEISPASLSGEAPRRCPHGVNTGLKNGERCCWDSILGLRSDKIESSLDDRISAHPGSQIPQEETCRSDRRSALVSLLSSAATPLV